MVGSLLLAGLAMVGCGGPSRPDYPVDRIVFITIDTLRADHMASFGYPIDTMPFVDSLAARGTSFKQAFAHSATTGPSHSSMFTGLYPIQHRVQNNGLILDDSFVTIAERLDELGFATAAFVSGMAHFGESRIGQGFEVYNDPPREARKEGGRLKQYRPADETIDSVVGWLDGPESVGADDPLFLWVHLYDPHKPLRPPRDLLRRATPSTAAAVAEHRAFLRDVQRVKLRNRTLRDTYKYDAEVMLADQQIERLFDAFTDRGMGEGTLWIVTSDHGQGLGDHGWFGHHEKIYNAELRVPLIFYFADGSFAAGDIEGAVVEHVDIPATILDLLGTGLEAQPEPVQGKSLMPLLRGDAGYEHKQFVFAERRRIFRERKNKKRTNRGEQYALQDGRYKYLWLSDGPDEFYDLLADPYEVDDLIDSPNPRKDEMKVAIEGIVAALRTEGEAGVVDDETLKRLRALGYLR